MMSKLLTASLNTAHINEGEVDGIYIALRVGMRMAGINTICKTFLKQKDPLM